MGIVIKIMDDFLDRDIDIDSNQWNISISLGRAVIPYSLLLLIISLYLNFAEAVALFAASYIIGMLHSYRGELPTGLNGWQEGIVVLLIFIYILPIHEIIAALIFIWIIQCLDDIIDYKKEIFINQDNIINKIGYFNAGFITIILIFILLKFFLIKFLYFSLAGIFLYIIFFILEYRENRYRNDLHDY